MTAGGEAGALCPPSGRCRVAQSAQNVVGFGHIPGAGATSGTGTPLVVPHGAPSAAPAQLWAMGLCLCHTRVRNLNLSAFRDLLSAGVEGAREQLVPLEKPSWSTVSVYRGPVPKMCCAAEH